VSHLKKAHPNRDSRNIISVSFHSRRISFLAESLGKNWPVQLSDLNSGRNTKQFQSLSHQDAAWHCLADTGGKAKVFDGKQAGVRLRREQLRRLFNNLPRRISLRFAAALLLFKKKNNRPG
jgi:hypothetical protein